MRQRVRKRAKSLCEYCHSPERISGSRFTLDHVYPRSLGGSDDFENLALACSRCNQRRYNFITEARALWVQAGWHPPEGDPLVQ
ncbi:MAG: HNH endonuclease signature motif containing protein [Phormidesmis sp.]